MKRHSIENLNSRFKMEVRAWLGTYPSIFYIAYNLKKKNIRELSITPDTDIVIEGFPRSANTYAVVAFESAQRQKVRVAHHMHAPAQLHRAARLNIPSILLIRDPIDAVVSLHMRSPQWPVARLVRWYCRFYRSLFPITSRLVIVEFNDVITDFGSSIELVNMTWDCDFDVYRKTERNEAAVKQRVVELDGSAGDHPGTEVRRSSLDTKERRDEVYRKIHKQEFTDLIDEARLVYRRILNSGA